MATERELLPEAQATQVVIEGQAIDLHGVTQASYQPPILRREYGYVAIGLGILLMIVGYLVWQGIFLTPMLGGTALVIVGAVLLWRVQTSYTLRLLRNDGEALLVQFADSRTALRALAQVQAALAQG